ncbi:MAG: hypothetical protein Tsb0015_08920 [Simkaniaceae bacterium]
MDQQTINTMSKMTSSAFKKAWNGTKSLVENSSVRNMVWTPLGAVPTSGTFSKDDLPEFALPAKVKEVGEKAFFKGFIAAPILVAMTQPAVVANKRVQLGMQALGDDRIVWAKFPKHMTSFYAGGFTSLMGKFPSQFALLATHEVSKSFFGNFMEENKANALGAVAGTLVQNLVKSPFTYLEQAAIQQQNFKIVPYLIDQKKLVGSQVLLKQLYSGLGPKILGDMTFYPIYTVLSSLLVDKRNDSTYQQVVKSLAIGSLVSAFSYPFIRVQTEMMKNAKNASGPVSMQGVVKQLWEVGAKEAKAQESLLKKSFKQLGPYYKGAGIAVFGIMPLQAVAYLAINRIGDHVSSSIRPPASETSPREVKVVKIEEIKEEPENSAAKGGTAKEKPSQNP